MKRGLPGVEASAAINAVEAAIKAQYPKVRGPSFEPDMSD